MRYDQNDKQSENIEDRRGERGGGGGMGIPLPMGGGKGGFSLMTMLIIGAVMLLMGKNPLDILTGGGGVDLPNLPQMPRMDQPTQRGPSIPGLPGERAPAQTAEDEMGKFVGRVLKDTEDVWDQVFAKFGRRYEKPPLVLFTGSTRTACGRGEAAMGPFYCPADQKIYIDLQFYNELRNKFGAPGDFAQAYVIAHEVGHHVQNLLGIADKVQASKQRMSQVQANHMQVLMELQADCFAGVWAAQNHQLKNRMERGDIEEGLNAAAKIGDDTLQRQSTGRVVPEAFTHGSAAQRVKWFRRGMETGQIQQCDTFNSPDP